MLDTRDDRPFIDLLADALDQTTDEYADKLTDETGAPFCAYGRAYDALGLILPPNSVGGATALNVVTGCADIKPLALDGASNIDCANADCDHDPDDDSADCDGASAFDLSVARAAFGTRTIAEQIDILRGLGFVFVTDFIPPERVNAPRSPAPARPNPHE